MKDEKEKKTVQVKLVRHKWPDEIAAEKAKRRRVVLACAGAVLFFVVGFLSSAMMKPVSQVKSSGNQKLNDVYDTMLNKWYFGKDMENLGDTLLDQALSGMVGSNQDPFTQYLTRKDALELSSSLQGSVMGIGIEYVSMHDGGLSYVERVMENGPADEAGMKAGDMMVAIDGTAIKGLDPDSVQDLVLGKEGSIVTIDVLRENKLHSLQVKRGRVNNSVLGEVRDHVGLLTIRSFAENSGRVTGEYFAQFEKAGVKDLVIDLRGNGGGYLNATVEIADYLLDKDSTVLWEEVRDGERTETKTPGKVKHYDFENIIVLVDRQTASASEVLTAALKEHLGATIVGEKTYGKGTVQVTVPFEDGSALKYTMAQWLTPNQKKIHEKGITPDVEVTNNEVFDLSPVYIGEDTYQYDSVSSIAIVVQMELRFLGYDVDRVDGYFSEASVNALKQYQTKIGMEANGMINQDVLNALFSSVKLAITTSPMTYDLQLVKALEIAKG